MFFWKKIPNCCNLSKLQGSGGTSGLGGWGIATAGPLGDMPVRTSGMQMHQWNATWVPFNIGSLNRIIYHLPPIKGTRNRCWSSEQLFNKKGI